MGVAAVGLAAGLLFASPVEAKSINTQVLTTHTSYCFRPKNCVLVYCDRHAV